MSNSNAKRRIDNLIYILEHPKEYTPFTKPQFTDTMLRALKEIKDAIGTDYISIEESK